MVEGKPSTGFWLVFALPFQQSEYDPSKLASQYHQRLSGAEASSSLLFVKAFPGGRTAGRHGCIVQKPAGFRVTSLGQTPTTILLS